MKIMGNLKLSKAVIIIFVFCAAAMASAQTLTTLANFDGANGSGPSGELIQATDGNFYGTTYFGGAYGSGTVFKVDPTGVLTTLYNFDYSDGYGPSAALVQATDGNLYGTTLYGGSGQGTAFKITLDGTLTTLYDFCIDCYDGFAPSGLIQAIDGNFYGTTQLGGEGTVDGGTVFTLTPSSTETPLHLFCSKMELEHGRYVCADGQQPNSTLVQRADGIFYGTTSFGGAYGGGTIFTITPAGKLGALYSFCAQLNCPDGWDPVAKLSLASNGRLYGTTSLGGANGFGTFFTISGHKLTTLYDFCAQTDCADGGGPTAMLVQATDGNFCGTISNGGAYKWGTAFKITPEGTLTVLYTFCAQTNCVDGSYPTAGLLQATDGSFYGTTYMGGSDNSGTVFRLSLGLGPFVKTLPTSGPVGSSVAILGTNLTGATAVSFTRTPATFTVVSSSEIMTTVPVGAKSGTVTVRTPSGTLKSNVRFHVTP